VRRRVKDKRVLALVKAFFKAGILTELKMKIRALTHRQSQQQLRFLLIRFNQIMRGWANYFKHAAAEDRSAALHRFVWRRLIRMLQVRHGRNRGEPVASSGARRVRRKARGNGRVAIPAPRPGPYSA
jgi:group II intron maturase